MSILLESDFLTVNLKSVLNTNTTSASAETPSGKDSGQVVDWGNELKNRLADKNAQSTAFEIESNFWKDFFNSSWDKDVAIILNTIDLLKTDIKKLGFNKKTNPILAFLLDDWVKENLLKTKLINSNTYKAIHNAVKRWVADSEFKKANNYNIIYCRDLYSKPIADIAEFLKQQKSILPLTASVYTKDLQNKNKSVFLQKGQNSMRQSDAKLKSLAEIEKLIGAVTPDEDEDETTTSSKRTKKMSNSDVLKVIQKLTKSVQVQAMLQYISMTTGSKEAADALQAKNFKDVSNDELLTSTVQLSKFLNDAQLTPEDAAGAVEQLKLRLQEIR